MDDPAISRLEHFSSLYKQWLFDKVDPEGNYRSLLDLLFDLEFTWILEFDANRAEDGVYLRAEFGFENDAEFDLSWVDWPCSILEMLFALARKIEDNIMYSIDEGDRTSKWFWLMVDNLGIRISDGEWTSDTTGYICHVIDEWLNRRYDKSGFGGLFPMKNSREDQRNLEIWWQMHEYFQDFQG